MKLVQHANRKKWEPYETYSTRKSTTLKEFDIKSVHHGRVQAGKKTIWKMYKKLGIKRRKREQNGAI